MLRRDSAKKPILRRIWDFLRSPEFSTALFLVAFSFFLFQGVLKFSLLNNFVFIRKLRKRIRYTAVFFLFVRVLTYRNIRIRDVIKAAALLIIGYAVYRFTTMNNMYVIAIFVVTGKDITAKQLSKAAVAVYSFFIPLTIICTFMGVINNITITRADGMLRCAMGFTHPNTFGLVLFIFCLSLCGAFWGAKPYGAALISLICAAMCWIVANSRTYTLMMCLLALLMILFYHIRRESLRTALRILLAAGAASAVMISLYYMVFYDPENALAVKLDTLLSYRLQLANLYFQEMPLNLLGTPVGQTTKIQTLVSSRTFVVDNAYAHTFMHFGIIPFVLLTGSLAAFYVNQIRGRRWSFAMIAITLFVFVGVCENMTFRLTANYYLTLFSAFLYHTPVRDNSLKRPRKREKKSG